MSKPLQFLDELQKIDKKDFSFTYMYRFLHMLWPNFLVFKTKKKSGQKHLEDPVLYLLKYSEAVDHM